MAYFAPATGQWLRGVSLNGGVTGSLSLSRVLLAALLALAGMGIDWTKLRESLEHPATLFTALAVKLIAPAVVVFLIAAALKGGPQPETAQLLLGLALIAAMPAAGSSPAWTQAAGGDVAVSVGLLVGSTVLGPLCGSLWLDGFAAAAGGDQLPDRLRVAVSGLSFLAWVIVPTAVGMALRHYLGTKVIARWKPYLRLAGAALLLLLIYVFASEAISRAMQRSAPSELASAVSLAALLCCSGFLFGWLTGRLSHSGHSSRVACVYGVGMHNNGIALLVADAVLPSDSAAFAPIIAYALVQHLLAGAVDALLAWRRG
ncbi:Sodium Bile acid symporter family protein [Pseudobythopirellula maris]|uniref:Sodium Bile acid symporter family protein n=1 Tax=Pseudobythopirellula maris TaxID=2527991 RepID=A0A5C5ZV04_9BACT|nr:Sodium Bile acid symporter family protein [Pseudobythopirellula maris]